MMTAFAYLSALIILGVVLIKVTMDFSPTFAAPHILVPALLPINKCTELLLKQSLVLI